MMNFETHVGIYWSKVDKRGPDECWPWLGGKNWKGYGQIRWDKNQQNSHRIAWMLTNGPIPEGQHCLHDCDNPSCQNPAHLHLGDNDKNIEEKMARGRHRGPRGEKSGSAILTAAKVFEIRAAKEIGTPSSFLSDVYGVSKKQIQAIWQRRTWKHI